MKKHVRLLSKLISFGPWSKLPTDQKHGRKVAIIYTYVHWTTEADNHLKNYLCVFSSAHWTRVWAVDVLVPPLKKNTHLNVFNALLHPHKRTDELRWMSLTHSYKSPHDPEKGSYSLQTHHVNKWILKIEI